MSPTYADHACPTRTLFRLLLLLALGAILLTNAREILRYIRLSAM